MRLNSSFWRTMWVSLGWKKWMTRLKRMGLFGNNPIAMIGKNNFQNRAAIRVMPIHVLHPSKDAKIGILDYIQRLHWASHSSSFKIEAQHAISTLPYSHNIAIYSKNEIFQFFCHWDGNKLFLLLYPLNFIKYSLTGSKYTVTYINISFMNFIHNNMRDTSQTTF